MNYKYQPTRRAVLAVGVSLAWVPPLRAQEIYPNRPIKIVVGAGAGGTTDITARLVGQQLSKLLGQPAVIENKAGFDALHVPFKGGAESANAIMGGNIQFLFDALSSNLPLIRSSKLKALAVTGPKRVKSLPDVPTMSELGLPSMTMEIFFGLVAAPNTPELVVAKLADAMKMALTDPALRESLANSGNEPQSSTPQEFRAQVDKEGARFQALIKSKGIVAE